MSKQSYIIKVNCAETIKAKLATKYNHLNNLFSSASESLPCFPLIIFTSFLASNLDTQKLKSSFY